MSAADGAAKGPTGQPHPIAGDCIAVVLAAGRGERMGTPKALLPMGGVPLALAVARAFLAAGVRPCLLVVADPLRPALAAAAVRLGVGDELEWVSGPEAGAPMIESVRRGLLRAVALQAPLVYLHPVDAGSPAPAVLDALRVAVCGKLAAKPTHSGRGGHPVLLTFAAATSVLSTHESTLRSAMAALGAQQIARVEVPDAGVLNNWNRPEDLPPAGGAR